MASLNVWANRDCLPRLNVQLGSPTQTYKFSCPRYYWPITLLEQSHALGCSTPLVKALNVLLKTRSSPLQSEGYHEWWPKKGCNKYSSYKQYYFTVTTPIHVARPGLVPQKQHSHLALCLKLMGLPTRWIYTTVDKYVDLQYKTHDIMQQMLSFI